MQGLAWMEWAPAAAPSIVVRRPPEPRDGTDESPSRLQRQGEGVLPRRGWQLLPPQGRRAMAAFHGAGCPEPGIPPVQNALPIDASCEVRLQSGRGVHVDGPRAV